VNDDASRGPYASSAPAQGALTAGLKPPHSIEAEREVLAAVFVDPNAMDALSESLKSEDFYLERHQLLFTVLFDLHERAVAIDPVTVQQALKDRGLYEKIGGVRALSELLDRSGTVANLEHYCEIVRQKAVLRRMVEAARRIETAGLQEVSDVEEFLDEAERSVFSVLEDRANTNLRPISEVVVSAIDQIQAAFDAEGDVTGVGTGFRDWDKITHGLQGGDLIILAARPAMGKTSFVLNVASNAALKFNRSVAIFSLEMPAEQLVQRLLSAESRIDLGRMRGGYINDDEWPRLVQAADDLAKTRIFIDDLPGATPSQVRAKCRRVSRQHGLDLVIIDYLQLMNAGVKQGSREQEISYISRALKGLAKDLKCPVVALSQLNRGLESRTDKRPLLSDLRESGAIEQDADMICFIYREEVYNKEASEEIKGIAELIIGKHRNGPIGTVKLKFWSALTRFDNLALQT
jgi:replicative DNA helicase